MIIKNVQTPVSSLGDSVAIGKNVIKAVIPAKLVLDLIGEPESRKI
jgi:hypothetical protein